MAQEKQKLSKFMLTYGIDEMLYGKITPAINKNNHKTVTVVITVCVLAFAIMGILRALDITNLGETWLFVMLTAVSLALLGAERTLFEKGKHASTIILYVLLVCVAAYAIYMGIIILQDKPTTTICLLLCIAPSILVDRPWRIFAVSIIVTVVVWALVFALKTPDAMMADIIDSLVACALGLAVGVNAQSMRVRSFVDDYAKSRAAKMDGLTGVLNKSTFEEETRCLIEAGIEGALLIIDADHFKDVNDTYGHSTGDEIIKAIANSIEINRRGSDLAGRFGGDEFCVLLVGNIPPETPQTYFTRLIGTFAEQTPDVRKVDGTPLTLSCGAKLLSPHNISYEQAFEEADAALYEAKKDRNNTVVIR